MSSASGTDSGVVKFQLQVSEWLNTSDGKAPELGDINLALVMQVNCPGCVLMALPHLNSIWKTHKSRLVGSSGGSGSAPAGGGGGGAGGATNEPTLQVMVISTAFEDFEYNSVENTRRLMADGSVFGESARAIRQQLLTASGGGGGDAKSADSKQPAAGGGGGGTVHVPYALEPYPVAFDKLSKRDLKDAEGLKKEAGEKFARLVANEMIPSHLTAEMVIPLIVGDLQRSESRAHTLEYNDLNGTPSWIIFDRQYRVMAKWTGHEPNPELIIARALKPNAAGTAAAAASAANSKQPKQ